MAENISKFKKNKSPQLGRGRVNFFKMPLYARNSKAARTMVKNRRIFLINSKIRFSTNLFIKEIGGFLFVCLFFLVTHLQLQCGLPSNILTRQAHFWILYSQINGSPSALLKRLWILACNESDSDYTDKRGDGVSCLWKSGKDRVFQVGLKHMEPGSSSPQQPLILESAVHQHMLPSGILESAFP